MDSTITLISENMLQDELGAWMTETSAKRVFCRVHSIDDNEFYEAGRSGLNPAVRVSVFHADYNGETKCEYDSENYSIYRTRKIPGSDYIDLYLERKGGSNGQKDND